MAELVPLSRHPGTPDPTAALTQALEAFESVLTKEQKQEFHMSNQSPDISSVVTFVAEIDANNSTKTKRSVAVKLYNFLESTQKFTTIVDTFVSSNPQIAGLIWGGLKVAILSASNISSYFDKLTSMIMAIGKSCPKYQEFGQLYPGCTGLQRELCNYYAIIVRICIRTMEISRRAPFSQILSSIFNPFEFEFQSLLIQLEQAAKHVRLEITLAANQAIEEMRNLLHYETQRNRYFRRRALNFHEQSQKEYTQANGWRLNKLKRENSKLRSTIKDNLSTINFVKPWKQALRQRVSSTAEWLQQETTFFRWKDSQDSAVLWCPGKMGVGKTTLMSNIVAYLYRSREPNDVISYNICCAEETASLSARSLFGTIARQLLDSQIDLEDNAKLRELEDTSGCLDTEDVIDLLLSYLEGKKQYFLILDGLDEFDSAEIKKVSSELARLCKSREKRFKLICAGRYELEEKLFGVFRPDFTIPITGVNVERDIDHYISTTLGRCLEEEDLKLGDPGLIIRISTALREGSNGMFLWTRLFIEDLCAQSCDNDIINALNNLPRGLLEIFDRRISRIYDRQTNNNAIKVLQYCGVFKKPLTVMEYREALSLSPGQESIEHGKFPSDMNHVFSDCCGLVYIDEEEDTVHYVHQSVKQYLFTTNSAHLREFDVEKLDRHLGFLCMTYLDFSDFKRQLTRADKSSNTRLNPIQLGLSRIHSHNGATNQIALKLLSRRHQLQGISARELENKIEALRNEFKSPGQIPVQHNEFQFHEYAETNWIYHTTLINPVVHQKIWKLFCRCMEDDDISAQKPWEPMQRDQKEQSHNSTSVQAMISSGHLTLLVYIMQRQPHSLTEEAMCEILKGSPMKYRFRFTHLIVARGSSLEVLKYGVFFAAQSGCIFSLNLSIRAGADVNTILDDCSVLEAAAGGGHLKIVERLLSEKADFARPISSRGKTCLHLAAAGGHLKIVERLLMAAEEINSFGTHDKGGIALLAAAKRGHLKILERLLAAQAVHHIPAHRMIGETALQGAAAHGHLETVKKPLAAGADFGYQETISSALEVAVEGGHLEIVERLLEARANVKRSVSWEVWGARAFQLAVIGGYWKIGERLLAARAEVAVPASGYDRGRALQAAAERGHFEMVNVLLTDQVNFDAPAPGEMMETAIKAATRNGHSVVAGKLKQALLLIEQL
ncbi:hypothetical protein DTO013E5_3635 [Penicillium roqueforti]|uniref:Ankyrin repeat-containing domain n=1 Tax=Penicillium roqueforti (strain FM164) TaxID=1365484 RepID=W6Q617_PENRF|nr:uncharacterized protein LCP9604111_411 [Penicillium roqueforti]CDM32148.1 Ankyrin repeat-containing domain [Penicillium roqueforti FM164]KAF9252885.1 hypothetical protein LCP9604111_411 [Penicillium roqueforti]KAI2721152.1 hypothetical protein CBS147354_5834 [Penicillium roqueforti]KAI2724102.1 hypothetical protein CBS147318_1033 [Penicillium roqueforti]KAI2742437.1 hypothetical protein DTO012A1_3738 [Penicillium roqueforti]